MEVCFDDDTKKKVEADKRIGVWGSFVLLANNITGPGLVILPLAYQLTGWVGVVLCVAVYSIMSVFSILFIAESMTKFPGNEKFESKVEFLQLCKAYLTPASFQVVLFLLIISLLGTNVSAIVESAQVFDEALLQMGAACGLELYPHLGFTCIRHQSAHEDSVFGDAWVVSIGFLILVVVTIPFGMLDLGDNIGLQIIAFFGLLGISIVWSIYFFTMEHDMSRLPAFGKTGGTLGFILFNFAYVVTIPSWINEKAPEVDIRKSATQTALTGFIFFTVPCMLAAVAMDFSSGQDMLSILTQEPVPVAVQVFSFTFPWFALVTTIPVMSIILRNNLMEQGICSRKSASFWAVIFPWVLAIPFYGGDMLNYILTWVGIFSAGPLNFIVPAWLYLSISRYSQVSTRPESMAIGDRNVNGSRDRKVSTDKVECGRETWEKETGFEALPNWQRGRMLLLPYAMILCTLGAMLYATIQTFIDGGKSNYV